MNGALKPKSDPAVDETLSDFARISTSLFLLLNTENSAEAFIHALLGLYMRTGTGWSCTEGRERLCRKDKGNRLSMLTCCHHHDEKANIIYTGHWSFSPV